jgi:hypothetical protein
MTPAAPPPLISGVLDLLRETFEGGNPGEGTGFLDNTKADGSDNRGWFATVDALTAEQASRPTALDLSVAAHTSHAAYHLEVGVRWASGERGPFDWKGSFEPRIVNDAQWDQARLRLRKAYRDILELARRVTEWNEDNAGGLAAALAHAAYHLGAVRQLVKLAS